MAFDSEAAASEVMRVRKSLAEKREARAHFLDREDATDSARGPEADLDLDLDLDEAPSPSLPAWPHDDGTPLRPDAAIAGLALAQLEPVPEPAPELDLDLDLTPDPWRQPGETTNGTDDAQTADAIHFSLALEDYDPQPRATPAPDVQTPYEIAMDLSPLVATEGARADTEYACRPVWSRPCAGHSAPSVNTGRQGLRLHHHHGFGPGVCST